MELMDPKLVASCSISEVMREILMGLLCMQERAVDRPSMSDVVLMLSMKQLLFHFLENLH